ncbi:UvrD-helicase domain-containing protein [Streptomyces luteolifulvus]|uniref:UvrD-helicase domain-containing protein n=1 Tax=Streptomyces luteolifulvus TaxID=2615112 RepID=UPI00177FDDDF|nr:UvrD-helicase domain-containing protein [Streptomyces luteolifulvus]
MTDTTAPSSPVLSDEQRHVVEQDVDARMLVTAGAGTGKTFCLVRRLAFLVEEEDVSAADILVLSYSRAAVREVRERLSRAGSAAQHVDVRTFDSYATRILSEADPDGSWQTAGYDGRIAAATHLLRTDENAAGFVEDLQHLVVDEVQDLVGHRAEFVKALLELAGGGFTLLGDPAQGIYGFLLEDPVQRRQGAATLYAWVRERFAEDLTDTTLSHNRRVRDSRAGVAHAQGVALSRADADFAAVHRDLRTSLLAPECHLGALDDAWPVIADLATAPTAVLCRTNGQALRLSAHLHERGVAHRLQRSGLDRVVPAWVAGLFTAFDTTRPSKEAVLAHLEAALKQAPIAAQQAWTLIKRMDGNRGNRLSVDLGEVAARLAQGRVPDELVAPAPALLVVSTIHRAKGLEFDNVIVVDPGPPSGDLADEAEETRLLYVAMSRPRDLLLRLELPSELTRGVYKNPEIDRWVKRHPGAQHQFKGRRYGMEIRGDDVHAEDPAGTVGFTAPARAVQHHLASTRLTAAPVTLVRSDEQDAGAHQRYVVHHDGVAIGVTSQSFAWSLQKEIGRQHARPDRVEDLRIDCVETVVGSQAASINNDMGPFGVWLRPRLVGMGRFVWPKKGQPA